MRKKTRSCLCDEPTCRKCLGVSCEIKDCRTHSIAKKIRTKEVILQDLKYRLERVKKEGNLTNYYFDKPEVLAMKIRSMKEELKCLKENTIISL